MGYFAAARQATKGTDNSDSASGANQVAKYAESAVVVEEGHLFELSRTAFEAALRETAIQVHFSAFLQASFLHTLFVAAI